MNNNIFDRLKTIELARFFISNYNYRDMEIKNVEGIFLENRSSQYQIIRISNTVHSGADSFNKEVDILNKVIAQFKNISSLENVKMINIYFDGYCVSEVGSINSLVIQNNDDIRNNILLTSEFPLIMNNYNLDQVNQIINSNSSTNQRSVFNLNRDSNNDTPSNTNTNEKRIVDMFNIKEINKKTKFTKFFTLGIVIISLLFTIFANDMQQLIYEFSFYDKFALVLNQSYRLFTGLFISDNLFFTFLFAFFFYRYNTFIELKLGTKKTIILYVISLISIVAAMIFILQSQVVFGTLPLLSIMVGAYFGVILLPSQRDFLKLHLANSLSMLLLYALLSMSTMYNFGLNMIALACGFIIVMAVNAKDEILNKKYIGAYLTSLALVCIACFAFNSTLTRSLSFEQGYYEYIGQKNEIQSQKYKSKMDDYYKSIGAIDYD